MTDRIKLFCFYMSIIVNSTETTGSSQLRTTKFVVSRIRDLWPRPWTWGDSSWSTTKWFLLSVSIKKFSPKAANKSGYWVVYISVGFLQKVFSSGKTSNRKSFGVVIPSSELIYGNTLGNLHVLFFAVYLPVVLRKASVSNQ